MSAVRTMQSLSLFCSLRAKFWALVWLGLGGWEDLRTLLTSALSSSASWWLSLVQAASMAVIYSKLGGCLGVTTKLGPLARTYLCAGVKGLLERLMTHLGSGSSGEDPWGSLLGGVVWLLPWVPALSAWEAVLFPGKTRGPFACLTYYLDCLTDLLGENCLPGRLGKPLACLLPQGKEKLPACLLPGRPGVNYLLLPREGEHLPGR